MANCTCSRHLARWRSQSYRSCRSMADINEREAWAGLQDAFARMRDFSRALALLRTDQRWLAIAGLADRCQDSARVLYTKSERQGSKAYVTPPGEALQLSQ